MPAYSNAPPGISPEMWAQISGNYNQAEATDPTFASRMQQRSDETNALRAAQTGSMGMLQSGPMSSGVSDPSQAFQKFLQSGYTGQQAINDGWPTGTGKPGWQNTAGYQAPLNPQGMTGAPYAQQQIQQYQQSQSQPQSTGGGSNPFGSQPRSNPAAMAYGGGGQQRGGGIYQQLNSMLGPGGGQGQYGASASPYGGSTGAPPRMQGSSGTPPGGYGQRQNAFGQSPAWQNFLGNLNKPGGA
jgi:hypothetical protein